MYVHKIVIRINALNKDIYFNSFYFEFNTANNEYTKLVILILFSHKI